MNSRPLYLVLINLLVFFCLNSCDESKPFEDYQKATIQTPKGGEITAFLAISEQEQVQGLSGVPKENFPDDYGMLFIFKQNDVRQFWMPNTYFALDIFFLDSNFKVYDLQRNVPNYIGRDDPKNIPRTKYSYAQYVLEMKASSKMAKKINIGDQLKWKNPSHLEQIKLKTHLQQ